MLVKRGLMNINTFFPFFHALLHCHCVRVFSLDKYPQTTAKCGAFNYFLSFSFYFQMETSFIQNFKLEMGGDRERERTVG